MALLIVARAVNIGASILLEGIFTFVVIIVAQTGRAGSNDFEEIERRLLRLAILGVGRSASFRSVLIFLARVRGAVSLGEAVGRVLQRFSTLSLCCVSVLAVSGLSNSWLLVGSIHALFTTSYGRLLLFKLTLFAVLIGFGARNRFLIKANLLKDPASPDLLPQLRRNVLCEVCLGAAVVAIVVCLGVTPPARHP